MIRRTPHTDDVDLDPVVAAELAALEAALNGAPGADPALTALIADVRAEAAPMAPGLRRRLDEAVEAGFPRARRFTLPSLPPGRLLPALGIAASALIALVVAVGALRSDGTGGRPLAAPSAAGVSSSTPAVSGPAAFDSAAPQAKAGASSEAASPPVAGAAPSAGALAPAPEDSGGRAGFGRKVERSVELTLRVGAGELEDTADGVVRATQAAGGYVADSQVSARNRGGSAVFTLRIPTARLDQTLAKLSKLGHVAAMDQGSRDITSAFVSVADRLSDARAERKALLKALGAAKTQPAIASLRRRIANNRSEIAALKGQLTALRRRADLSTVALTVEARGTAVAAPTGGDDRWGPAAAARDALRVLSVAAGVLVVGLAALLPVALIALLAWFGVAGTRRRRREHALDGA